MDIDPENIVKTFIEIAKLSGAQVSKDSISYEALSAPHLQPSNLPSGMMAVYSFFYAGQCLKVGKVNSKSKARYTSQHYNPKSSRSNLAKSLLIDREDLDENDVGDWIRGNTDRMNLLVSESAGTEILNLLEAYLQCLLRPKYEGFKGQNRR